MRQHSRGAADLREQIDMSETTAPPKEPDRACTLCRETKPAAAFHRMGPKRRRSRCASCHASTRDQASRWAARTHEERQDAHLRETYGITLGQYHLLLTAQRGVCATCGQPPSGKRPLAVDHCHQSGRVRALLCIGCNSKLGAYELFRTRAEQFLAVYGRGNPLLYRDE